MPAPPLPELAALQLHPTAGHDLSLDAGPWLAGAVRHWRDTRTGNP